MRGLLRIVVAVGLAIGLAPVAQAGWLLFESPGHGFAALFPRTPSQAEKSEEGVTVTHFGAGDGSVTCVVIVVQYPPTTDMSKEIYVLRAISLDGVIGTLTANKRMVVARGSEQLQGLEFEADAKDASYRFLIAIDGQRAYRVSGGIAKAGGDKAELDSCVGGFKLLPKA